MTTEDEQAIQKLAEFDYQSLDLSDGPKLLNIPGLQMDGLKIVAKGIRESGKADVLVTNLGPNWPEYADRDGMIALRDKLSEMIEASEKS